MRFHTILTLVAAASALPTITEEQHDADMSHASDNPALTFLQDAFRGKYRMWRIRDLFLGRDKQPGCHNGMNWMQFTRPIGDTTHQHTAIAVGSPWNLGHNRDLWKLLEKRVGLLRWTDEKVAEEDHCYWRPARKTNVIKRFGVPLAYVDFHADHPAFYEPDMPGGPESIKDHALSDDLINRIEETVSLTYPWREITLIVVMAVLLPLILLIIVGAVCCGGKRMGRKHRH